MELKCDKVSMANMVTGLSISDIHQPMNEDSKGSATISSPGEGGLIYKKSNGEGLGFPRKNPLQVADQQGVEPRQHEDTELGVLGLPT